MTTEIIITNLAVRAFHGVFPEERRLGNNFTVNATLRADFRPALTSDSLNDTLEPPAQTLPEAGDIIFALPIMRLGVCLRV